MGRRRGGGSGGTIVRASKHGQDAPLQGDVVLLSHRVSSHLYQAG